jgi:hypothetical protein
MIRHSDTSGPKVILTSTYLCQVVRHTDFLQLCRFKIAFAKYGNGPKSNRKIAEFIGNGVHPNHVAYFKSQLRKNKTYNDTTIQEAPSPVVTTPPGDQSPSTSPTQGNSGDSHNSSPTLGYQSLQDTTTLQ